MRSLAWPSCAAGSSVVEVLLSVRREMDRDGEIRSVPAFDVDVVAPRP